MKIRVALASAWWGFSALAVAQAPYQYHPPMTGRNTQALDDSARDAWQMPHDVVMALDLQSSETVAEIGAGAGYFARRLATHARKVYAVDMDGGLLASLRKDAPPNLETILAPPEDPRLPAGSVDTVFFCNVLHQVADRAAFYPKVARALKPGGRVVVLDFYKRGLPVGPPPEMKISEDQMIGEFEQAGFKLSKRLSFLPYQYYLFFEKR